MKACAAIHIRRLTEEVILILEMAMSAPRSTIHQLEVSGADQKQVSGESRPSTASVGVWVDRELLAEAVGEVFQ